MIAYMEKESYANAAAVQLHKTKSTWRLGSHNLQSSNRLRLSSKIIQRQHTRVRELQTIDRAKATKKVN